MEACSLSLIFILMLQLSYGFQVLQPSSVSVNGDGLALISCEHDSSSSSLEDVKLHRKSVGGELTQLCQKGMKNCKNVVQHRESLRRFVFILLNVGPVELNFTYQCEMTVSVNGVDYTAQGTPTTLLRGQQEEPCEEQSQLLCWILIGLLVVMSLSCCVISGLYLQLRHSVHTQRSESQLKRHNSAEEVSTYVEMRKAPLTRPLSLSVDCGKPTVSVCPEDVEEPI